jgi:hypothetical protein
MPIVALGLLALAACSGEIYLRDGVTDGDTFYLPPRALSDADPARQAWVRYNLVRSTCQLQIGGANPARANSYECELTARRHLLESWHDSSMQEPTRIDTYLDELATVQSAGYLDEYVVANFGNRSWRLPDDLDMKAFHNWSGAAIPDHVPETRVIGSWSYAGKSNPDAAGD